MATANDGLTWSEDVVTLAEAASSHTLPVIVRVEEGSCGGHDAESFSRGDIFKLDFFDGETIRGYYYTGVFHQRGKLTEDDNIQSKQILIYKDIANTIDVTICLTKCDNVLTSTPNARPPPPSANVYVDFTLPVPATRTSLQGKSSPPPVPARGKTRTTLGDDERKPMPPPRKPSTSSESERSLMDAEVPKPPPRAQKSEISATLDEEPVGDVYEVPDGQEDNIYDEADDLEVPTPSSPDYSLKHRTKEFFSKLKMKDKMQKIKTKLATVMKREKTADHKDDVDDEDIDDYEAYEIPDSMSTMSTKRLNEKQFHNAKGRYDMLEKRLTLPKPPNNPYTSLHVGGADQQDNPFVSLSINGLANRLVVCGLSNVAEICRKEKVDGRLFYTLTDDDLREVFSVNELQIKKIRMAQNHDWTPKT